MMKLSKVLAILIWIIMAITLSDISYALINKASSIANVTGIVILVLTVCISIKTKCFISIKSINK